MEKIYRKIFFKVIGGKNFKGRLSLSDSDGEFLFGDGSSDYSQADIKILKPGFYKRVVFGGDTGFGEAFFLGEFETSDLKKLLLWFVENKENLPGFRHGGIFSSLMSGLSVFSRINHKLNKNTKKGSKKNIKAHYDLSNDFYRLWLDETFTYSAAIFEDGFNLRQAQENKYKKICEAINLKDGDQVLEIGCGWGGFASYVLDRYDVRLTLTTISDEQYSYVQNMLRDRYPQERVVLLKKDYRELEGSFDKIVSIEMMEALGHEYVPLFISLMNDLLRKGGLACLQFITYPDKYYKKYLKNTDYIEKYIFPGGELLSLAQVKKEAGKNGLVMLSSKSIGADYAKTLSFWRDNFLAKREEIKELGFSDNFIRKWIFYFVYCEVGFETSYIDDWQITFEK